MTILVTNDDGVFTDGLQTLVRELKKITPVVVVAPDREQSAIGTAVTLLQPLRVRRVRPVVPEVDTYSVEGTPSDCVILALSTLIEDKIGMVISGINQGANLGDDVFISGTVAAALQGYFRGLHAIAISTAAVNSHCLDTAAKLATLLVKWLDSGAGPNKVLRDGFPACLDVGRQRKPLAETPLPAGLRQQGPFEDFNARRLPVFGKE